MKTVSAGVADTLLINCIAGLQEINITAQSVTLLLPDSCYTVDLFPGPGSFNVCDNNIQGLDSHIACTKDGTLECKDTDPAVGKIRVAVVAGEYDLFPKKAPPNHNSVTFANICDPDPGIKCEATFLYSAKNNPWFPWDLNGDKAVAFADFLEILQHFGERK